MAPGESRTCFENFASPSRKAETVKVMVRFAAAMGLVLLSAACGMSNERGIADKRSDFSKFLPIAQDVSKDGLKEVKPFFRAAKKEEIMRAIERACAGKKAGSSVYEPRSQRGYYVNCNPRNRQLLNGYVPANPKERPHSR